jgi:hypothetical protein
MPHRFPIYILALLAFLSMFPVLSVFADTPEPAPNFWDEADDSSVIFLPFTTSRQQTQPPSPTPTATPQPSPTLPPIDGALIVDHTWVDRFDSIPPEYLQSARNIKMMFSDRSVGANISEGLNCLPVSEWLDAPSSCRRDYTDPSWNWKTFGEADLVSGTVPERILYDPHPTIYDRSNWVFEFRQGTWDALTEGFVTSLAPQYINAGYDIVTYQFSYLNVGDDSSIASPTEGFFANNPNKYDIYDLEEFLADNPQVNFFFWTSSLARGIGSDVSTDFNHQMREYVIENDKILFDVADILSHTPEGQPCYDNRDGVPYLTENYPDDGQNYPAICQDYTTETDGGHLGSVSAGKLRVAKAFWVLMARIAGWNGQ